MTKSLRWHSRSTKTMAAHAERPKSFGLKPSAVCISNPRAKSHTPPFWSPGTTNLSAQVSGLRFVMKIPSAA